MAFRRITVRPHEPDGDASTNRSHGLLEQHSSSSASADFESRPQRDGKAVENGDFAPPTGAIVTKRRRVGENITKNACKGCKKARSKCDGKLPCSRCAQRTEQCTYEVHVKHAKEELVKKVKDLTDENYILHQIVGAIAADEQTSEIMRRLRSGESHESIVSFLGRSAVDEYSGLSPTSGLETSDHEQNVPASFRHPHQFWTTVSIDEGAMDHLFQLYFAWIHPVHTVFHEGFFVKNYKRHQQQYCSSILVNAICAMACHLNSDSHSNQTETEILGSRFADAARAEIDPSDRNITTIQALAVLFLFDSARGHGLKATQYLSNACNGLSKLTLQQDVEGFADVVSATCRGIRVLNVEWAQMTAQMPILSTILPPETLSDVYNSDLDAAQWFAYTHSDTECRGRASLLATTNREKAKLAEIISDVVTMFYGSAEIMISPIQIMMQYDRFLTWKTQLPKAISELETEDDKAMPHVVCLLVLYSTSISLLLRPVMDFEGFPHTIIHDKLWRNTQEGLLLMHMYYTSSYTCRYMPVLQMFNVLHLCDAVARFFPAKVDGFGLDGVEAMSLGVNVLTQCYQGFPVARTCQEMLRRTSNEIGIEISNNLLDSIILKRRCSTDEILDACTRFNYTLPADLIQRRFNADFSREWMIEGPRYGFIPPDDLTTSKVPATDEETGARNLMHIRNLLNEN